MYYRKYNIRKYESEYSILDYCREHSYTQERESHRLYMSHKSLNN
jgi:hypothetical protein